MSDLIKTIEASDFENVVSKSTRPVVVDFFSTECPPCDALAAKFEALAELWGEDVAFIKIFRQGNRELAGALSVTSSPTLLFYRNGKEVGARLSGGIKRSDIEAQLQKLVTQERAEEINGHKTILHTECDLLIIGAGPAGLTAGIYAAQAKLRTIIVDRALAGGNLAITHMVSNFPGFPEPQPGFMLAHQMFQHTLNAGAEFRQAVELTEVDLTNRRIVIDGVEEIVAKRIVIATGSSPRSIGVVNEVEYKGKGISYCATCDAKYYEGKHVVVIGGGNSALEESMFISKFAARITIVHQFAVFQANKSAQEAVLANKKISILFKHEPRVFVPKGKTIGAVEVEDLESGEMKTIECDGVFVFAGMRPNLEGFDGQFDRDEWGYIKTDAQKRTSLNKDYPTITAWSSTAVSAGVTITGPGSFWPPV